MIRVARLVEHRGALHTPAADARRVWNDRAHVLVVLEDGEGHFGLGEAAPLPGYSPDSLEAAWDALAPLVGRPLGEPARSASLSEALRTAGSLASPAARFALETALVDLRARKSGEPAWRLVTRLGTELGVSTAGGPDGDSGERAVAALLPSGEAEALVTASAELARGTSTFKLKIGSSGAWAAELATLRALRRELVGVSLRADANQSFSPAELREKRTALAELELEWLEEPTALMMGDEAFGVPIALDESLQTIPPEATAARARGVVAYVLKPTTLGGLLRSLELAREAGTAGIACVVSHVYEGPVAFGALASLALALGPLRPADGLGPHPALDTHRTSPALRSERSGLFRWNDAGLGLEPEPLFEQARVARELRA